MFATISNWATVLILFVVVCAAYLLYIYVARFYKPEKKGYRYKSLNSDTSDYNDQHIEAMLTHVMTTGKSCIGHVDDEGNLIIEDVESETSATNEEIDKINKTISKYPERPHE